MVELDACLPCELLWFDATEIEKLKVRGRATKSGSEKGAKQGDSALRKPMAVLELLSFVAEGLSLL
jgi:Zn-finger nucleic acid-binding protein